MGPQGDSEGLTAANSHAVIARALLRIFGRTPVRIRIAGVLAHIGVVCHRELTQAPIFGELRCAEEFPVVFHVVTSVSFSVLPNNSMVYLAQVPRSYSFQNSIFPTKTQFSVPKLNFPRNTDFINGDTIALHL